MESNNLSGSSIRPQKTIRIFISSPGDVAEEREKARAVIARLASRYGDQVILESVLWEDFALNADEPFQPSIEDVLSSKHGIDIAVFILWSRLGSPLGKRTTKIDGTPYRSGTERELVLMLEARAKSKADAKETGGTVRPAILVYTRKDNEAFDEALNGKEDTDKLALIEQRSLVKQFIREEFHDTQGHNLRAYHTYQKPPDFSGRLRVHLIELLDELLGHRRALWEKEPYVGLQAFQFEQDRIFMGRDQQVCELAEALRAQADRGCAFVLVAGASGSGKSSLVRAGLLPALCFHEVEDTVAKWRRAILRPGEHDGNLLLALVRRLADDENGLPELRSAATQELEQLAADLDNSPDVTIRNVIGRTLPELRSAATQELKQLAADLDNSPDITVRNVIGRTLQDAAKTAGGIVRLVLLVDQLEELFTDSAITPNERERFLEVLETLAQSGHVWVVATLRSDFYDQVQKSPALMRMREGRGMYDLLPVDESALRRIIVTPASLAGLKFEGLAEFQGVNKIEKKQTLEDRIYDDALKHPELLPHLQYLLRELYEARTPDNLLTHADYTALDGVSGVLGHRAETVFAGLDTNTQAAFDPLMCDLVTIQTEGAQNAVRRHATLCMAQNTPAKNQLTDALVDARLLTADKTPAGEPMVSLAHDTLLTSWEKLKEWVVNNSSLLKIRSRIENAARIWVEEKAGKKEQRSLLLPPGVPLLEGRWLLKEWNGELEEGIKEYIKASMVAHRWRKFKRAGWGVLAMALLPIIYGLVWGVKVYQGVQAVEREMAFVSIPKGCFLMGSSNLEIGHQDNEKQHEVCVKKFDLGKFEVTQEQWEKVMLGNLLQPVNLSTWKDEENLPVQMVNWFEAQEFVRNMNWFGHWQYRLPTEAEWEYAARAGEKASWHWGNNEKEACDYANVMDWRTKSWLGPNAPCRGFECSDRHPNLARVGSYKANAFGLYDIIGNVSEWTCSAYGTYDEDLHKNCSDSSVDGSRVLRGGNWYDSVVFVRSAYRWVQDPNVRGNAQGLRLARTNR